MKLTEDERTSFSKFRNVSDLRVQFLCEYRFYLQEKLGQRETRASIDGSRLHESIATAENNLQEQHQIIPIIVMIAAIIIGCLLIFG